MREHRVVGAGGVDGEHRALDRLGHHLAPVEPLHQIDLGQVLVHREQRKRGQQRALRGAGRGRGREAVGLLARTVPLLAPEVQRRDVRAHVGRCPVDDLRPEPVELLVGVAQSAGDGQLHQIRDGIARRQQGRLGGHRAGLLQNDPEVVRAGRRRAPRLLDQELRVDGRGARVLRRLGTPLAQPRPAHARLPHQLQRGGPGERLHPLPPHLAVLRRPGQQLGRRPPLLRVLDDVEHVEEILVGARHPDVQLLLAREAVGVRIRGVG